MAPDDILSLFGGRHAVAARLGTHVRIVHGWADPTRGIPAWAALELLAWGRELGIEVPLDPLRRPRQPRPRTQGRRGEHAQAAA